MVRAKTGVATYVNQIESRTDLTHCHSRPRHLAVGETIKTIKIMKGTLDATFELNKLIKYSMA